MGHPLAEKLLIENLRHLPALNIGLGHELGNILTLIASRAELAKGRSQKEMDQAFETILHATKTAKGILEQYKNLSQPLTLESEKEELALHEPLQEALTLLNHQMTLTRTVVDLEYDHVLVDAHSTALVQVFINLLLNSLQAMGDDGKISIRIKSEGAATIEVKDSGPGMPKDLAPYHSTKGSSGLGLAICKEILSELHGGQFEILPSSDGAHFKLTLPKKEKFQDAVA